ncbi:MAG: efflux RND transporter periplasmic adaptor subunit [Pyramidobacter sp.]|nr:efflux RND transporter periplasmic adaptor subunit [Pyramidobacter sp.]
MKKSSSFSWLKLAGGIAMIAAACLGIEEFRRRQTPVEEPEIVRPVRTTVLGNYSGGTVQHYFGTVQGAQRVNLSFRVSGPLKELPAEKGAMVKKGDVLARLDPRDFRTRLEQAQGVLAQARAQYSDAAANFKRYEELYKQKVIAAAKYDGYKAQLSVTRSAVKQAEAGVSAARDALRDTELRAPFDGVVAERMTENFQDVVAKQPVLSLQNISTLEIVFSVPDSDVQRAPVPSKIDMKGLARASEAFSLTARFDAIPGRDFPVKLKEFGAQADPGTKTYPVTVTMPQPEGARVLPGMAVSVAVDYGGSRKQETTFLVPQSAILGDVVMRSVWRCKDGSVESIPVAVLAAHGNSVEISAPLLNEGDVIVTAGVHFLREGQKVRLMKAGDQ